MSVRACERPAARPTPPLPLPPAKPRHSCTANGTFVLLPAYVVHRARQPHHSCTPTRCARTAELPHLHAHPPAAPRAPTPPHLHAQPMAPLCCCLPMSCTARANPTTPPRHTRCARTAELPHLHAHPPAAPRAPTPPLLHAALALPVLLPGYVVHRAAQRRHSSTPHPRAWLANTANTTCTLCSSSSSSTANGTFVLLLLLLPNPAMPLAGRPLLMRTPVPVRIVQIMAEHGTKPLPPLRGWGGEGFGVGTTERHRCRYSLLVCLSNTLCPTLCWPSCPAPAAGALRQPSQSAQACSRGHTLKLCSHACSAHQQLSNSLVSLSNTMSTLCCPSCPSLLLAATAAQPCSHASRFISTLQQLSLLKPTQCSHSVLPKLPKPAAKLPHANPATTLAAQGHNLCQQLGLPAKPIPAAQCPAPTSCNHASRFSSALQQLSLVRPTDNGPTHVSAIAVPAPTAAAQR